jgi:ketosteroid isomerase-like protein
MSLSAAAMEATIRAYFADCNRGDAARIAGWFVPEAVHYFPAGSPFGTLRGAEAIGRCWADCVAQIGSHWTVDNVVANAENGQAVIEWTHFKTRLGQVLRGDEWYRFASDGRILEIRAYYACPTHAGVAEHGLGGFAYADRGYPMAPKPS